MSSVSPDSTLRESNGAALQALWRRTGLLWLLAVGVLFFAYWDTAWSIGVSWEKYKSYSHGYLVVPISAYIVWLRRQEWLGVQPAGLWWVAALLLPVSLGWAVASLLDVQLGLHVGFFLQFFLINWALLGNRAMWVLAAPLAYLFLALPIWNHLVPVLQDHTADTAAWGVRAFGVPVFHEGYYLVIPEGTFVVAEVCAGLRYLLATLSICGFYAMLNLRHWASALVFIAGSVAISVVFNWIRVVMVILAGHLTEMQSPIVVGSDAHIIHGWVTFGVALIPIFFLGSWLQRREEKSLKFSSKVDVGNNVGGPQSAAGSISAGTRLPTLGLALGCIFFAAIGPIAASLPRTAAVSMDTAVLAPLPPPSGWTTTETEH